MTVKRVSVAPAILIVILSPAVIHGDEKYAAGAKGSVAGFAATGDRKLDDKRNVADVNAELQAWLKTPRDLSLYADGRYFGSGGAPGNTLREAYADWEAGDLGVQVGKQIIAWGRADRINPTDVITPRNYEVLSRYDDDQRFGVEGALLKYYLSRAYSISALALPAFCSSKIPSGILPPGLHEDRSHEHYSWDNRQWGLKIDRTGDAIDWSVSYYRGFSTSPEIAVGGPNTVQLENRRIWMAGLDFAATTAAWGIRGEAAYVKYQEHLFMPQLFPHSSFSSVLGAERAVGETLVLNLQWIHRWIADFSDPLSVQGPFGSIARGNAQIHSQFEKRQDGISASVRNTWLYNTLRAELSAVIFSRHAGYSVRPEVQYDLNDAWTAAVFAECYGGPDTSFLGGLRKNSIVYAELRYRFGPFEKKPGTIASEMTAGKEEKAM